jgi:hypothetical protein
MATARRNGRQPGKSDPIDAEAVALAALRHDGLPVAELDGQAREVRRRRTSVHLQWWRAISIRITRRQAKFSSTLKVCLATACRK